VHVVDDERRLGCLEEVPELLPELGMERIAGRDLPKETGKRGVALAEALVHRERVEDELRTEDVAEALEAVGLPRREQRHRALGQRPEARPAQLPEEAPERPNRVSARAEDAREHVHAAAVDEEKEGQRYVISDGLGGAARDAHGRVERVMDGPVAAVQDQDVHALAKEETLEGRVEIAERAGLERARRIRQLCAQPPMPHRLPVRARQRVREEPEVHACIRREAVDIGGNGVTVGHRGGTIA
jgi:hypothetical protein